MTIPRRSFLRDAVSSTLSVGFLLTAGRASFAQQSTAVPLEAQKDPVFLFIASTFEPYVGDVFTTPNARGVMVELRLLALKKYEAVNRLTSRAGTSTSFSLMFKASAELPPFTSIYTVSHPALGKFDLFLSRRKTETGELFYEAVINHAQ